MVPAAAGGWKSEIRVSAWSGSGKDLLPGLQTTVLPFPHMAVRERPSLCFSGKNTNFIREGSTLMTQLPPKGMSMGSQSCLTICSPMD